MGWKKVLAAVALRTALPEWALRHRARHRLTVLNYHRIQPLPDADYPFDEDVISATPEEFERELRYLRRHLDLIPLSELLAGLSDPRCLPERPAIITLDDGYRDNVEIALPILRDVGAPACFFVVTGLVGTAIVPWWDQVACCMKRTRVGCIRSPFGGEDPPYPLGREQCQPSIRRFLGRMKMTPWGRALQCLELLREESRIDPAEYAPQPLIMGWEAVRLLSSAGMDIGGHTRTHPLLGQVQDPEMLRDEIQGCYTDITREIGKEPAAFAYPVGSPAAMSPAAEEEIAGAGFRLSFSFIPARTQLPTRPDRIPRLCAGYREDFQAFRRGMALAPTEASRPIGPAVPLDNTRPLPSPIDRVPG